MTFADPLWLIALSLLAVVIGAYVSGRRRRRAKSALLAAQGLVANSDTRPWLRHLPFGMLVVALALLIVAIARPMATIKTPRRAATVVIAIDVSNSMAARDVAPSRFGAAKAAARAFVNDQSSSVRIGVVAFGPGAVIVQPPTPDRSAVTRALSHLALGGGTSISSGLLTALDAISGKTIKVNMRTLNQDDSGEINIGYFGGATILLISDGEDTTETGPLTMARLASSAGVHIQTIGVGTPAGTTVKIDGFDVATAEDPQTLRHVAAVANGAFHQLSSPAAVADVSSSIDLHLTLLAEHTEVSALFALAGGVLLLLGALFSLARFGRVI